MKEDGGVSNGLFRIQLHGRFWTVGNSLTLLILAVLSHA